MKKSLYLIAGILIGITLFGGSSVLGSLRSAAPTVSMSMDRKYT
jgi:hypothetical protein